MLYAVFLAAILAVMFIGATMLDRHLPMADLFSRIIKRLRPIVGKIEGYQDPELIDVIYRKTVKYEPAEPWPEISGVSSVLDFGGGCGIHYKQALNSAPDVRWAVVETPAMVARAKTLATDRLKFFTDIDDAASWLEHIDVVHSNGALQYADDPIETAKKLCGLGAGRMMWSRLFFGSGEKKTQTSLLEDNGPGTMKVARKTASYEHTTIREAEFLEAHSNYLLVERGPDWLRFAKLSDAQDLVRDNSRSNDSVSIATRIG